MDFVPIQFLKNFFVILGGFIQGIYTIGGPFVLMGYKDYFSSKQELRSTMAGYFFIINTLVEKYKLDTLDANTQQIIVCEKYF